MSVIATIAPESQPGPATSVEQVQPEYLQTLSLIERLHRLLLDVVKDDFERTDQNDINSVQALILFNIGDEVLTAGDLRNRGYYQGSNVSYNLKKLVEGGYLDHKRCDVDRRAVRIQLTDKGQSVRRQVDALFARHASGLLEGAGVDAEQLEALNKSMAELEYFWRNQIRFIY